MANPSPADLAAGVPQGANIVARVPAPSGKGELLLDANGGVYDTGGQSFSGSYYSLAPEQRQGSRSFTNIVVDPKTGGYKLVSNIPGQEYNFGPSEYVKNQPRANPLYSDPAFLAYAANSGRDYETAAADVQRRKAALQNALTVQTSNLEQKGQNDLKSVYGDFASRGLTRPGEISGQQAEKEGQVQSQNLADIAAAQGQTASQIEGLQSDLAKKRSDILAEASQRGYDTAGQQDLTNKFNEVDRRYPLGGKTGLVY